MKIIEYEEKYLDDLKKLEDWEQKEETSIFFNKNLYNYDSCGNINNNIVVIDDLSNIYFMTF